MMASPEQSGFGSGSGGSKKSTASKLVSYNQDGTVILRAPDRMYLSSTNFSLHMAPVLSVDSGEYFCLVNDQRQPSLVTRILVQGKGRARGKREGCFGCEVLIVRQSKDCILFIVSVQTVGVVDVEVNYAHMILKV